MADGTIQMTTPIVLSPDSVQLRETQAALIPHRVAQKYPAQPTGRDVRFFCSDEAGRFIFAKGDDGPRRVRAAEWIGNSIARHLGLPTADFDIIEDAGETYFGSVRNPSTADQSMMKAYLSRQQLGELGQPLDRPGRFLSSLHALDLLLNNVDRYPSNFALVPDGPTYRLVAIDFGSARLADLASTRFPSPTDTTMRIGKPFRTLHGNHIGAALEIVDRVAAIPMDVIDAILQSMPSAWMTTEEKRVIRGDWLELGNGVRLPALRAGLKDGSLA
jgi:hypothetical protein